MYIQSSFSHVDINDICVTENLVCTITKPLFHVLLKPTLNVNHISSNSKQGSGYACVNAAELMKQFLQNFFISSQNPIKLPLLDSNEWSLDRVWWRNKVLENQIRTLSGALTQSTLPLQGREQIANFCI